MAAEKAALYEGTPPACCQRVHAVTKFKMPLKS